MTRVVSVCLLLVTTALAQENPAPVTAKNPPPADDAIAAAKREFGAIKSLGNGLEQSPVDLPRLSAPELRTAPAMPRLESPAGTDLKAAKKSPTWLVDAMMKSDEKQSRDPRTAMSGRTSRDRATEESSDLDLRSGNELDSTNSRTQGKPIAEKQTGPEFNPLNRYMSGWMTAQDYSLLKPGLDAATASSGIGPRNDPSLSAVGAALPIFGDSGLANESGVPKGTAFTLPSPADNPFLQSLTVNEALAPTAGFRQPAGNPPPTIPGVVPAPVEIAPPKSKIPDFAKPATDEKFFKQLKRF